MGDLRPAEATQARAACYHLFKYSMRKEARRLRTFRKWPATSPISPRDLVKAGFYFVGPRDEVQCFCCGGVLKEWVPGDCPVAEHLKYFPSCAFIRGEAVGNQEMPPRQESADTVDGQFVSLLQGMDSEEAALPNGPEYPEMVTEEARLLTFQNSPRYADVHAEALARAGFFYTGQDDVVRCFYCNGSMRNWSFRSDPWWEHAKWFPGCEFLLRSTGRDFISSVQESLSNASFASQLSTEEQLRCLKEEKMCKVCLDKDVSVVFVPCGHLVTCRECALNLRLCPICRAVIQGSVRTYMS
ncbi:BIR7B protein, partial [Eolophus roseicapillus]|nr:BIR7B protein [Eolophus roseicapilla]